MEAEVHVSTFRDRTLGDGLTPIRLQVGNCLAERGSGVISPGSHKQQSALLVLFDVVLCDVLLPRAYNAQATDQEKYGPLILLAHLPNPLRAKLLDLWMDVTSGLLRGSVHDHTDIAAAAAELTLFVASESPRRDTRLRQIWMDSDPNAVRNTDLLRSMTALERWGLANGVKAIRSVLHLINTTPPHHFLVNKAYVKMPFPLISQAPRSGVAIAR